MTTSVLDYPSMRAVVSQAVDQGSEGALRGFILMLKRQLRRCTLDVSLAVSRVRSKITTTDNHVAARRRRATVLALLLSTTLESLLVSRTAGKEKPTRPRCQWPILRLVMVFRWLACDPGFPEVQTEMHACRLAIEAAVEDAQGYCVPGLMLLGHLLVWEACHACPPIVVSTPDPSRPELAVAKTIPGVFALTTGGQVSPPSRVFLQQAVAAFGRGYQAAGQDRRAAQGLCISHHLLGNVDQYRSWAQEAMAAKPTAISGSNQRTYFL
jgi:hypothetical protein